MAKLYHNSIIGTTAWFVVSSWFGRVERVERVEVGWGVIYLTRRRREAESAEGIGEL